MAITYVGGQTGSRGGSTSTLDVTFSLTGGSDSVPSAGDLVVVTSVVASSELNPDQSISYPTGYTALTQLNAKATAYDTSLCVSYKIVSAGVECQEVRIRSTTWAAAPQGYTIQVFRGFDTTNPIDTTPTSATGTGTGRPDPSSITPIFEGSWILICGGGASAVGSGATYTAPANYTTNFLTSSAADTDADVMVGSGYRETYWTSGAENPATYTGGTTGANDSWVCYTIAIRPDAKLLFSLTGMSTFTGLSTITT